MRPTPLHGSILVFTLFFLFLFQAPSVQAATITVGPGCTLIQAIQSANSDTAVGGCTAGSGADTISLPGGIYTFSNPWDGTGENALPPITSNITIQGANPATTVIERIAGSTSDLRLLYVEASGNLTVRNVTLRNGCGDGGGLRNAGTATVNNVTIIASHGERGSGIYNTGSLTLISTTFTSNRSDIAGGGLYNSGGNISISNSAFNSNEGGRETGFDSNAGGGAIYNATGTITISNTTFTSNSTTQAGGAIVSKSGTITLENSTFSNNSATNTGGAILAESTTLNITGGSLTNNAGQSGGGIAFRNPSGPAFNSTIRNVYFFNNRSTAGGGGIDGSGSGTVVVTQSLFESNQSTFGTGGIVASGTGNTLQLANVTISGNRGTSGGLAVLSGATGQLTFTTVYNNTATGGVGTDAGGLKVGGSPSALARLSNSLFGGNTGGDCIVLGSSAVSGPNNLLTTACGGATSLGVPTGVQALAANGGPTKTHSLLGTSNAINTGQNAECQLAIMQVGGVPQDQRGIVRPQPTGNLCDIGAFEVDTTLLTLTPTSLPGATLGVAYSTNLTAGGGTGPYTFTVLTAPPAGLTLATTGTLSGTPTVSGNGLTFDVQLNDSLGNNQPFTLSINIAAAPTITLLPQDFLPRGGVTLAYSGAVSAQGGTGPYSFMITSGSLPLGLNMAANGTITGTPIESGTFNFDVEATDSNSFTGTDTMTLIVDPVPTFVTTPSPLPDGALNIPYSQTFTTTGGTAPYTYSTVSVVTGLTLSTAGVLSGTPTADGSYGIVLRVRDARGFELEETIFLTINLAPVITITPTTLPDGARTVVYSAQLTATGGATPYSFSALTPLPAGLTLAANGSIGGTPTVGDDITPFTFNVQARDALGNTGTAIVSITIANAPTITLSPATLPDGALTESYSYQLQASGGTGPYTYAIATGTLPPGLTMTPAGLITGTPSDNLSSPYDFELLITDANGFTGTIAATLTINEFPDVTPGPSTLPIGYTNVPYSTQLTATGGTGPYSFTLETALPDGLTMNGQGRITGTPTTSGTFNFTVAARDINGFEGLGTLSITIELNAPLSINPASLAGGTVGIAYTQTLQAVGGTGPYTFSTIPASPNPLPVGLVLSPNGTIAGTPTTAGTTGFTVLVTDSTGQSATRDYTIVISSQTNAIFLSEPAPGTEIDLGFAVIGQTTSRTIVIREGGNATLTVSPSGDGLLVGEQAAEFSLSGDVPPFSIEDGGGERRLTVSCTPTELGFRRATLVFNTNGQGQPSASYQLICSGVLVTDTTGLPFLDGRGAPVSAYARVFFVRGMAHRTGPYLGATMLGIIRPGNEYPIYAKSDDEGGDYTWYLIEANDRLGWASGRYLEIIGDAGGIPLGVSVFQEIDNAPDVGVRVRNLGAQLRLRLRPSERSQVLTELPWGAELAVLGRTRQAGRDRWLHVRYGDLVGWIVADFVESISPIPFDATPVR